MNVLNIPYDFMSRSTIMSLKQIVSRGGEYTEVEQKEVVANSSEKYTLTQSKSDVVMFHR